MTTPFQSHDRGHTNSDSLLTCPLLLFVRGTFLLELSRIRIRNQGVKPSKLRFRSVNPESESNELSHVDFSHLSALTKPVYPPAVMHRNLYKR